MVVVMVFYISTGSRKFDLTELCVYCMNSLSHLLVYIYEINNWSPLYHIGAPNDCEIDAFWEIISVSLMDMDTHW